MARSLVRATNAQSSFSRIDNTIYSISNHAQDSCKLYRSASTLIGNQRGRQMPWLIQALALIGCTIAGLLGGPALAQQNGGVLKFYHRDSPASASIHEEATISSVGPFMGVFNNLVMFKQDEKQNRPDFIVPDLAESWSWNSDNTRLSFRLRQGVKWHTASPLLPMTSNAPGTCWPARQSTSSA